MSIALLTGLIWVLCNDAGLNTWVLQARWAAWPQRSPRRGPGEAGRAGMPVGDCVR